MWTFKTPKGQRDLCETKSCIVMPPPLPRFIEVSQVILHEADLPDLIPDFYGAHPLAGEHG